MACTDQQIEMPGIAAAHPIANQGKQSKEPSIQRVRQALPETTLMLGTLSDVLLYRQCGPGAAAYAIRAVSAGVPADDAARARAKEWEWQRAHLAAAIRELVVDDQQRPSAICWHVFDD